MKLKHAEQRPALPPKRGRGRPPKSERDVAIDKARAAFLSFALDEAARVLQAHATRQGNAFSHRELRAYMLRVFAAMQFKSIDTIRDVLKPARRVSRKRRSSV